MAAVRLMRWNPTVGASALRRGGLSLCGASSMSVLQALIDVDLPNAL